jgi:hypothetical protein
MTRTLSLPRKALAVVAAGLLSVSAAAAQTSTVTTSSSTQVQQQGAPDATLEFSGGDVAVGIGFSWADGSLNYGGQRHQFHVNGMSLADVGLINVTASGEVYNLKRIQDFAGTYAAVSAGATLGGGANVAYLRNQNGVVIKISSTSQGLNFHFAADGMNIQLES